MSRLAITKEILGRMIKGDPNGKTLYQQWTEKPPERVDKNFPFNLRILSRVNLDITPYLLGEGKLAMKPPAAKGTIAGIGVIDYGSDGLVDYLVRISPDNPAESDEMSILYIETQNNELIVSKLFTSSLEYYPESADEWSEWINEENGILGNSELNSPDGAVYYRMWGEGEQVEPYNVSETVYNDRFGAKIETNNLQMMLFGRDLLDANEEKIVTEFALVSVVNDSYIEIMLGVPINLTAGNIIGA